MELRYVLHCFDSSPATRWSASFAASAASARAWRARSDRRRVQAAYRLRLDAARSRIRVGRRGSDQRV